MVHTIIVQFRITGEHPLRLGSEDELDFRHNLEDKLDTLLTHHDAGYCDGGQSGGGTMEIFLEDIPDLPKTLKLVMDYLTNEELIGYCKIASHTPGQQGETVHYPAGATFSLWSWD